MYSLGKWFVSGICVDTLHKGDNDDDDNNSNNNNFLVNFHNTHLILNLVRFIVRYLYLCFFSLMLAMCFLSVLRILYLASSESVTDRRSVQSARK